MWFNRRRADPGLRGESKEGTEGKPRQSRLLEGEERVVGSKDLWLRNPANHTDAAWQTFKSFRESNVETARAWALKESAMSLFGYVKVGETRRHFKWWYDWAVHSCLTYATAGSINAKIQRVKYTARGFRNTENFKAAIYFHCGSLDMAPLQT